MLRVAIGVLRNKEIVQYLQLGSEDNDFLKKVEDELLNGDDNNESLHFQLDPNEVGGYLHDAVVSSKRFFKGSTKPLVIQKEIALHNLVGSLLDSYHELCNYLTTPYPFPLVQITKALVITWLFLLPFYMSYGVNETIASVLTQALAIFFMTYGFLGLECVAMELDDPFGEDYNDIEMHKLTQVIILSLFI